MLRVPDYVTAASVTSATREVAKKRKGMSKLLPKVERLKTGKCVQAMHTGPYERERETGAAIQKFISENGLAYNGPFHELCIRTQGGLLRKNSGQSQCSR